VEKAYKFSHISIDCGAFIMDDVRAHDRNLEEEWITKYRAAMQTVPDQEGWEARVRRIALSAYGNVATTAQEVKTKILSNKMVIRCVQLASANTPDAVNSEPHFSVLRTMHTLAPQKVRSVGIGEHSAKKAS
jgi:hypothetical protein